LTNHLCIVTNQSGVSRGLIERIELDKIHSYLIKSFENENISLSGLYVCTDLPGTNSKRRKPQPGMFMEAAENLSLSLSRCLMVGDSIQDILAGNRLNMETMLVLTGLGHKTAKEYALEINATYIVKDLIEGAEMLVGF
jgi:D-glycero-D-manno-heptose 1,7-bisphosphate phosphatase